MSSEDTSKPAGVFIPDEIWYAEDLKPIDVRIIGELRRFPLEEDGSLYATAYRVAMKSNCNHKTAASRIRHLAKRGWIKIIEETSRGGEGFRIQFLRAAVVAWILMGSAGALHNSNSQDKSAQNTSEVHII